MLAMIKTIYGNGVGPSLLTGWSRGKENTPWGQRLLAISTYNNTHRALTAAK